MARPYRKRLRNGGRERLFYMQTYVTSPFPPLRHVHILTQKGVCGLSVLGTREGVLMTSTQKKTTNHHHDLRHAGDLRRACNVRCVGSKRTPPRKLKSMLVRSLRRIMMPSNPTVLQKGISVCCTTQITLFFCGTIFLLAGQKKIFKVYVSWFVDPPKGGISVSLRAMHLTAIFCSFFYWFRWLKFSDFFMLQNWMTYTSDVLQFVCVTASSTWWWLNLHTPVTGSPCYDRDHTFRPP